ncbi:MAG: HAMP domain-containing protein [Rhodobacteraceae bacterium]|nr:HAMP domain-containing protein [Paracoccaceae bacterium]
MFFQWLKNFLPRSLYGRAALILLVPVVSIQLLVSVVFIQRHFNSITEQMTGAVASELAYLSTRVGQAGDLAAATDILADLAPALALVAELPSETAVVEAKRFDDLTGARVTRVLYQGVPGLVGVDLASSRGRVLLTIETVHGLMSLSFSRGRMSATNPHQLLVLMVFFSILMTIIAYFFLRNQLRPIKRLSHAAEAFGKGQVLPYHLAGSNEVRAAGQAFLDMRARIERQIEQRTLMLSGVSHDLRTPLTRLKLGLSMLETSDDGEALLRDVADMERLVDEFLSFARSDAHDGEPVAVDPARLLGKLIKNAKRAGQDVTLGDLAQTGDVWMRPVPVTRALENLLANAARYAKRATISLELHSGNISFVVEDDGPGIAPGDRDEALKPFTRLDDARNQDSGSGVGLGLAIAADIARAHGGQLLLGDSQKMGGLQATLSLPV